jgi:hypothetical protein
VGSANSYLSRQDGLRRHSWVAVILLVISLLSACGSSATHKTLKEELVHWRIASVAGPTSVRIFSNAGYCLGDPKPRYGVTKVVERADSVYISPALVYAPREKGPCRGVGYSVSQTIDLDRELNAVKLYDSTTSPPGLRWPKP